MRFPINGPDGPAYESVTQHVNEHRCAGCDKPFPVEYEAQMFWSEIKPAVGGRTLQLLCYTCYIEVGHFISINLKGKTPCLNPIQVKTFWGQWELLTKIKNAVGLWRS